MCLVLGTALTLSEVALLSSASFCQRQTSGSLGGEVCGEKHRSRTEIGNCALNQRPPELPPGGCGQQQPGKGSDGDPVLAAWLHGLWLGSSLCWGDQQPLLALQQNLAQGLFCCCHHRLFRSATCGWRIASETPAKSAGRVRRGSRTNSQPQLIFCNQTNRCFDHVYFKTNFTRVL